MNARNAADPELFGVIAAFTEPDALLEATKRARAAGYERLDTYSPFPIHGMDHALELGRSWLPWMVLAAGLLGACIALAGMLYINVVEYPIIVGGKPHGAVEPLVPIMFEVCVLSAAATAVFGMFMLNGLPRLHHPVFGCADFARASDNGFFLTIEASDPRFDSAQTLRFLEEIGGENVTLVEA